MIKNEKAKLTVNRVIAFACGALVALVAMNLTVVNTEKGLNKELAGKLDAALYEPGRLLDDANAQLKSQEYGKALQSLAVLFDKHPGSAEAAAGKSLELTATAAQQKAAAAWDAEAPAAKARWIKERTAALRAKSDEARSELEKGMDATLNQEWEREMDQVRIEWEKRS